MNSWDTSIGGPQGSFPQTTLGLFSRLHDPDDRLRHDSLETLCRRYWKPVYRFVRIAWAKSNDDAKDLTQAFFVWLLEDDALKRYAPEKGSFRGFLKVLLSGFVGNEDRALARLKRGGGSKILNLDDETLLKESVSDPKAATPEQAFDREWMRTLVKHAVDRVRERFASDGRAIQFRAYEEYELSPGENRISYAEVASRIGATEVQVRRSLEAVREGVIAELRAELSQTTLGARDLEEEWNALFGR